MSHDIFLLAALLVPTVVLAFLRINAVMVFMSLCLGHVLVQYVAGDANSFVHMFAPHLSPLMTSLLQVIILLAPAVLTAVFMLFSVHGRLRTITNILPAAGVGSLGVLLTVPLLPAGLSHAMQTAPLWAQLSRLQALIVGVSAIIGLVFLWSQHRALGSHGR